MSSKLKQVGLVASGLIAGIFISLNYSASAGKDAATSALPIEELRSFADVYNAIKQGYVEPVEDKKLITHAISGMLSNLDPHSAYLDAESFKDLQVSTAGEFGGLGIEVGMEDGFVKVVSPDRGHPGLPRRHQGRRPDHQARRHPGQRHDAHRCRQEACAASRDLHRAHRRPQGRTQTADSKSRLRVKIKVQSVKSKMIEPGFGYLRITQFQDETVSDTVKHLNKLFKEKDKDTKAAKDAQCRSRAWCSTCATIRAACSTALSGFPPPSCHPGAAHCLHRRPHRRMPSRKYHAIPDDYLRGQP
jgi:carboxyl-terminal processing protease